MQNNSILGGVNRTQRGGVVSPESKDLLFLLGCSVSGAKWGGIFFREALPIAHQKSTVVALYSIQVMIAQ